MESGMTERQLKFRLELIVITTINVLGLTVIIAAVSLLLPNIGVFKYVSAALGVLSGGLLGWLLLRHYLCFMVLTRLLQVGVIAFVLWKFSENEVNATGAIAMFPLAFLYTSLSFKKHWVKIKNFLIYKLYPNQSMIN
jgi:hypothetical protein